MSVWRALPYPYPYPPHKVRHVVGRDMEFGKPIVVSGRTFGFMVLGYPGFSISILRQGAIRVKSENLKSNEEKYITSRAG